MDVPQAEFPLRLPARDAALASALLLFSLWRQLVQAHESHPCHAVLVLTLNHVKNSPATNRQPSYWPLPTRAHKCDTYSPVPLALLAVCDPLQNNEQFLRQLHCPCWKFPLVRLIHELLLLSKFFPPTKPLTLLSTVLFAARIPPDC